MVILLALTFVSCKKNYNCQCTKSHTIGGTTVITQDGSYTFNEVKTRAITRCNQEEGAGSDAAGDYTRNCTIQ